MSSCGRGCTRAHMITHAPGTGKDKYVHAQGHAGDIDTPGVHMQVRGRRCVGSKHLGVCDQYESDVHRLWRWGSGMTLGCFRNPVQRFVAPSVLIGFLREDHRRQVLPGKLSAERQSCPEPPSSSSSP